MATIDREWLTNDMYAAEVLSKSIILEDHQEIKENESSSEQSVPLSPAYSQSSNSPRQPPKPSIADFTPPEIQLPPIEPTLTASVGYGRHPLHDPRLRPLHVVMAGAGPSGIAMAIELMKLANVTFEIIEKNPDVGGTWLENRYPGAACDVASHAYQYTFEQNTDWSHHFAPAEEIGEYFKRVASKHAVYPHVRFNSRVTGAIWDEFAAKWVVQITDEKGGKPMDTRGDIFINAGGILNDWKWPDIAGLDRFQGRRLHTAAWDQTVSLEDQRVGIIGSGATSVQVVSSIQPAVKQLEVFIRSPTYILPTIGFGVESSTFNEQYTEQQKQRFREDPHFYKSFRKKIEQQMNENFQANIKNTPAQENGRKWAEDMMRKNINSKILQEKLIPSWELGCRRLTPGLPYLNAIQQPNVEIVRTSIESICENGIQTSDGILHELDVLICATGFDTSFSARYDIVGRNKKGLRELWKNSVPEAYLGLAISGYPNYFTLLGPNCPIANGSLVPCIEASAKYIVQAIEKMQKCQIRSLSVKANMQRAFNDYIQRVHQDLVWTGSCNSWYKDRPTGKVTAVWPGSSIHFMEVIEQPRWEDYDIEYQDQANPFMFLGDGRSQREFHKQDLTYYLQ